MLELLGDPDAVLALGAWTYAVIALAVALDSVVPVVPSEVLTIAAGALVARGALDVRFAVVAVIAGGVAGDLVTYHVGRAGSRRARRLMDATPRRRRLMDRVGRGLARRRTTTIVAARFLPGGRTAVGLLAGVTRQPRPAVVGASLLGVTLWAAYALGLGYVGGRSVDDLWISVAAAVAVSVLVGGLAAVAGRRRRRSRDAIAAAPIGGDAKIAA